MWSKPTRPGRDVVLAVHMPRMKVASGYKQFLKVYGGEVKAVMGLPVVLA